MNLIKITIQEGKNLGNIDNTQAKIFINTSPRMPLFYTLPKIHKPRAFPPGRLIVSTYGAALELLAQFIDVFLQPFIIEAKSYMKDTTDFISKIEGLQISENAVITNHGHCIIVYKCT